jgi:c(7)-type cytochrome triheme protein
MKKPYVLCALLIAFGLAVSALTAAADKKEEKAVKAEEKKEEKAVKAEEKTEEKAAASEEKKEEKPADGEVPEFILLDKVGKLAPVKFPHALHGKKNECKDCHEGDKPLFEKKHGDDGMKMADMKAGKYCGACHDGKEHGANKKVFASTMCMKCHKK